MGIYSTIMNSSLATPARWAKKRLLENYYNTEVLNRLPEKIRPLKANFSDQQPVRINFLIPEISFGSFYGGYIAKFQLAKKLALAGHKVRMITVDRCHRDEPAWQALISRYQGLEDVLDLVEVQTAFDRGQKVLCSPQDRVIATTWWTAYIAHQLCQDGGLPDFMYLIQEFEPFTFAMGSYYAAAEYSYRLPHKAMFSTGLLMEYFALNRIGVFATEPAGEHGFFENAVLPLQPDETALRAGRGRKLLFYARPEAHAARNMFETAYVALSSAIEQGFFEEDWSFHGIGTRHGDIALPRGNHLKMLGKVGLKEYATLLRQYDIGLALMYTPHPSLLPLEMAASGQVVVSCECLNKTAEKMAAISANILAPAATVEGVTKGLATAVHRSRDIESRLHGARLHWPMAWGDAFDNAKMNQICQLLQLEQPLI